MRQSIRRVVSEWPVGLFLLSAVFGLLIAYHPIAAWDQFWRIVAGLGLYLAFVHAPERIRFSRREFSPLRLTLSILPSVVAVFFLLTNDWSRWIGKLPVFDPILRGAQALFGGSVSLGLNPNTVGGLIAAFVPLQVFALFDRADRTARWLKVVLISVALLGLMLSQSRGAWLTLALVAGAWGLWRVFNQWIMTPQRARLAWAAALAIIGGIMIAVFRLTPLGNSVVDIGGDRPIIWHNSLDLAGDYALTGLGLGGFGMAYSSYALLVHVGVTFHAHNLLLDIWLDQGLLGLVVFVAWVIKAIWPKASASHWRMAALASLAVILLHGLIDDAFYGYDGRAIALLFIPLALLLRQAEVGVTPPDAKVPASRYRTWLLAGMLVAVLLIAVLPGTRSVFESNIGAVMQTRAELSIYNWPEWPLQDVLRRSIDLSPVIARYQSALALDPANAAANRRLGQIELSIGQVDAACGHLTTAYAVAPAQRATRQLVGECAALAGHIDQAVELWRSIDVGQGQLQLRVWWYEQYLSDVDRAAALKRAVAALAQ